MFFKEDQLSLCASAGGPEGWGLRLLGDGGYLRDDVIPLGPDSHSSPPQTDTGTHTHADTRGLSRGLSLALLSSPRGCCRSLTGALRLRWCHLIGERLRTRRWQWAGATQQTLSLMHSGWESFFHPKIAQAVNYLPLQIYIFWWQAVIVLVQWHNIHTQ